MTTALYITGAWVAISVVFVIVGWLWNRNKPTSFDTLQRSRPGADELASVTRLYPSGDVKATPRKPPRSAA